MSSYRALTADEHEAIKAYAERRKGQKPSWKNQLLADWMNGRTEGDLQRLRNQLGPTWLKNFSLET